MAVGELWRHGDFLKLWSAQTVSSFGARIAREGVPLTAILVLGAGPMSLGVLAALSMGAASVVSLLGAPFVDRLPRRALLIGADLARAVVLLAVPAAALLHRLTLGEIYLAAGCMGALSVTFDMADHAYLPSLIGRALLVEGNSKLGATDAIAETGGPALGGLLIKLLTAPVALAVTAAGYLVSALLLSTIHRPPEPSDAEPPAPLDLDLTAGLRACLAHPLVRPLLAGGVTRAFFGSFFSALYLLFALNVLKLTPAMLGLTIGCGGVGSLIGAAATPILTCRFGLGPTLILTGLSGGALTFLIPFAHGAPFVAMGFLAAAQVFGDALQTTAEISDVSLRQSAMPPGMLGRTGGAFLASQSLVGVLGALAGGALGQLIGARETLYIAAAGVTLGYLPALLSPLRRQREAPEPAA